MEHIGRSVGQSFRELGFDFHEVSLLDSDGLLLNLSKINLDRTRMFFSWVSMGMDLTARTGDGPAVNLWDQIGVPFVSIHGDSPAYFFDRHVHPSSRFLMMYSFTEHAQLRQRLPQMRGPVGTCWPVILDESAGSADPDEKKKEQGPLVFLKNGKDPAALRTFWNAALRGKPLQMLLELASEIEARLDDPATHQLDDLIADCFRNEGFDPEQLFRLRLLYIAQLDDYLRAVKCTRMVEALSDFPVELRGNNWEHIDFSGKRITYIDECDYAKSVQHIRNALGVVDMSPNTGSRPHDRVLRAFAANTLCLTNRQQFLDELPHAAEISFQFTKESIQHTIATVLANPSRAMEMGREVAAAYRKQHPVEQGLTQLLDWADLCRLENLQQRLPGSQDFFIWPPGTA